MPKRILIMGAAGRDFHNFNQVYRNDPNHHVVAFTATQIPDISGKSYPPELAGKQYPKGIPIVDESEFASLIENENIDEVVFAYSDVSHNEVMHKASIALSKGADFKILGSKATMLHSSKPVVSITATRTGCGKSPASRKIATLLKNQGRKVVVIRHPMPYGNLTHQICQRFSTLEDMKFHQCTIEEMEEYEPHIQQGIIVYAGVDYERILREAEKEADVIIWDGGNNDYPFIQPNLDIVLADLTGPIMNCDTILEKTNFLRAQVIIISKFDSAEPDNVEILEKNIMTFNPKATIVRAALDISVEDSQKIQGKRALVIEDGPTVTHGGMHFGAGILAAKKFGASTIVDPRPFLVGEIAETFQKYPFIRDLIPAMGYSEQQIKDLEQTIRRTPCDVVLIATPIDLRRLCKISQDSCRVLYEIREIGSPNLEDVLARLD